MAWGKKLLRTEVAWRHVKTGRVYLLVGIAVCSTNGPGEGVRSAVYRRHGGQKLYYREVSEFLDGRFAPLGREEA